MASIDLPKVVQAFSEQIPGLMLGLPLGFLATRLLDRVRNRDARQESTRILVAGISPGLRQLRECLRSFDEHLAIDANAVAVYFTVHSEIITPSQTAVLQRALESCGKLDNKTTTAWHEASGALERSQRFHDALRAESRVARRLSPEKHAAYRAVLERTVNEIKSALQKALQHSDSATKMAIRETLGRQ